MKIGVSEGVPRGLGTGTWGVSTLTFTFGIPQETRVLVNRENNLGLQSPPSLSPVSLSPTESPAAGSPGAQGSALGTCVGGAVGVRAVALGFVSSAPATSSPELEPASES